MPEIIDFRDASKGVTTTTIDGSTVALNVATFGDGKRSRLADLQFLGKGGGTPVSIRYLDANLKQISVVATATIPAGDGANDPVPLSTILAIPISAVWVRMQIAEGYSLYMSEGAQTSDYVADFKTNFASYTPVIADAEYNQFGGLA